MNETAARQGLGWALSTDLEPPRRWVPSPSCSPRWAAAWGSSYAADTPRSLMTQHTHVDTHKQQGVSAEGGGAGAGRRPSTARPPPGNQIDRQNPRLTDKIRRLTDKIRRPDLYCLAKNTSGKQRNHEAPSLYHGVVLKLVKFWSGHRRSPLLASLAIPSAYPR